MAQTTDTTRQRVDHVAHVAHVRIRTQSWQGTPSVPPARAASGRVFDPREAGRRAALKHADALRALAD